MNPSSLFLSEIPTNYPVRLAWHRPSSLECRPAILVLHGVDGRHKALGFMNSLLKPFTKKGYVMVFVYYLETTKTKIAAMIRQNPPTNIAIQIPNAAAINPNNAPKTVSNAGNHTGNKTTRLLRQCKIKCVSSKIPLLKQPHFDYDL